jgi:mono/diheme cytochrome c family protein
MKIFLRILGVLAILILGLFIYVQLAWKKKFDAPYPAIKASNDSAVIARGKYLVYGPMHCATCHVASDQITDIEAGKELPLSGGWTLDIPPGTFRSRNLTSDKETGIGNLTDEQIARTLRYGVGHDGRFILPLMPFQIVSDEDMTAVISYLRTIPPVKHEVEPTKYKFLGKALLAFGVIKPEGPSGTPPKSVSRDSTAEYGNYLVNNVANCKGCHTYRSFKTGKFLGEPLAGAGIFPADSFSNGYSFRPPNLTPDPETGVIANWSETAFINRFRGGRIYAGSPMPWGPFSRMDETDLKAIYRYLKSIPGVKNKVEKTVYKPGEELPDLD